MSGQIPLRRRTVVRMIGAIAGGMIAVSTAAGDTDSEAGTDTSATADAEQTARPTAPHADNDPGASQYIAVVDRIVDESFVVLLLEDDGELVDQHVEPASEMDDVEETDILQVVLKDGSVLAYTHLDERPGEPADEE